MAKLWTLFVLYLLVSVESTTLKWPTFPFSRLPKHTKLDLNFFKQFRELEIGTKVDPKIVQPFLGHGGPYGAVYPIASKRTLVESDHAPHFSLLDYLNKIQLINTPQHIKDVVTERENLQAAVEKIETKITSLKNEIEATKTDHSERNAKRQDLEKENVKLKEANKALDKHNLKIKNTMGVLSIPYHIHRSFPTTRNPTNQIKELKSANEEVARNAMNTYQDAWIGIFEDGIKNGYIKDAEKFIGDIVEKNGKLEKTYDYEKLWDHNFNDIIKYSHEKKINGDHKPGQGSESAENTEVKKYMDKLYSSYQEKFITTSIYLIKTPQDGYSRLLSLYVSEYKMHLRNDFESYKPGIQNLLETSKEFGWLKESDISSLKKDHKLDVFDAEKLSEKYNVVENLIRTRAEKFQNLGGMEGSVDKKLSDALNNFCSTSGRSKRSTSQNDCIFHVNSDDDTKPKQNYPNKQPNTEWDDLDEIFKTRLPTDTKTVSIDSQRLNSYLSQLDDGDFTSARIKESLVEYVSKNSDQLTGSPDDITMTKALLKLENLVSHQEQINLAKSTLQGFGSEISAKQLSNFDKIKVSTSRIATKVSSLTSTTNKVGDSYGKIMLAKGLVSALRHGDFESLALMGGRVGLDFALEGIEKIGPQIAKKATTKFATKFGSQILGEMAGPIGAVADIGISAYSLAKSVKILKDPNATRFDQNDAIADIVADSIDIAITAVSAVLSMIFPPLAPLFGAIAFAINVLVTVAVGIFKAANHVNRLNADIPLLGFEKKTEFLNHVLGEETSGYIQDLIDTKAANNIAVNMTVQFLKSNPNYIGRVFPSKTMYDPEASCELQEKKCHKIFFVITLKCSNWYRVSYCNGHNGYCSGRYSRNKCQSNSRHGFTLAVAGFYGQNYKYQCKCGPDPPPVWGFDIPNSEIDFTRKRSVYLQRAAPDQYLERDFKYLCKPSSLTNEGVRVSNQYQNTEYLCKGAIGVSTKRPQGTFMWYDLGNGTDRVTLNENELVDNLFTVDNGTKYYYGNAGDDTFVFSGCSSLAGIIDGKRYRNHGNTIVIQQTCRFDKRIEVNLINQQLKLANTATAIHIRNIHRVFGRKDASDNISAACSTKLIADEGGKSPQDPDIIRVPSCETSFELVASITAKNTILDASRFTNGKLNVLVQAPLSLVAKVPLNFPGTLLFQFDSNVRDLVSATINNRTVSIILNFSNRGTATFNFNGVSNKQHINHQCQATQEQNQASILLRDHWNTTRHLKYDFQTEKIHCVFQLERDVYGNTIRQNGYNFLDNVFYLASGNWLVKGGNLNNRFILSNSSFHGTIEGGKGQNSLHLSNDLDDISSISINLLSGYIAGKLTIQVKNIENVYGRFNFTETVRVSNKTKYVDLGGPAKDFVYVPTLSTGIELTVSAKGSVTIDDRKANGSVIIHAGFADEDPCLSLLPLPLNLILHNWGGGDMVLILNFKIHQLLSASSSKLTVEGSNVVAINGNFPNVYFEEDYNLQSTLVIDNSKFIGIHELTNVGSMHNSTERRTSNEISNLYYLIGGKHWNVIGGNLDDTFIFVDAQFNGTVDGGLGSNSLVIGDKILGNVEIYSNVLSTKETNKTVSFSNMNEIHGRSGQSENITVTCQMKYIGLNGGYFGQHDIVTIPRLACHSNLTIVAKGFTNISSMAKEANLDVYILPDELNQTSFQGDLSVTESTVMNFPIQYQSYKLREYELLFAEENNFKIVELNISLLDNENPLQFRLTYDLDKFEIQNPNVNIMFIDADFNSNGNLFINFETEEAYMVHVLEEDTSKQNRSRNGAIGAKNIFQLHSGDWLAYGGKMDDSFILNEGNVTGSIQGMGGVNSLVISESVKPQTIIVNLLEKRLVASNHSKPLFHVTDIQVIGGRKLKKDKVVCACDTKLVMLEGGASINLPDEIEIQERFCSPTTTLVLDEFTTVQNNATTGNFTYHVRTAKNFDIKYFATNKTRHSFKFVIPIENFKNIKIDQSVLKLEFEDSEKTFPINFNNLPTFQISENPQLIAELILDSAETVQLSVFTKSPFSSNISGINGVKNFILVDTSMKIQSIVGGDQDDIIFLRQVNSTQLVDGGGETNRLELMDNLYQGRQLEVDFNLNKIMFPDDSSTFVDVLRNIQLFTGRKSGFERVVLGCDTKNVRFAEEIIVTTNCAYNVRIELEVNSQVIFRPFPNETTQLDDGPFIEEDEFTTAPVELLEPSKFFYHFSSIHSFDIEVDTFERLSLTNHIFFLNFTLSDLNELKFSLEDSRLIYTTMSGNNQEFSHLVAKLDDTELFYSQPVFLTGEGFLLKITRYGEILAVIANPEENLTLSIIQDDFIPRLSLYASKLGISFMLETGYDYIYCGSPTEIDWITNRETVVSHLIGFNQTTYEILDLDHDVYVYPQLIQNDSIHVVDLSDIVHQIRNKTQHKYIPTVIQVGTNLEIVMTNWTDTFKGKIILVNGTTYYRNVAILLNSVAMEILPNNLLLSDIEHRNWKISPRPIRIPEGHTYLFTGEDLEDGSEIQMETGNGNTTSEFTRDGNNLVMMSMSSDESNPSMVTSFGVSDYFPQTSTRSRASSLQLQDQRETIDSVQNIQVKLGRETVKITSNKPIMTVEQPNLRFRKQPKEVPTQLYEDVMQREKTKIEKSFPTLTPMHKIGKTNEN